MDHDMEGLESIIPSKRLHGDAEATRHPAKRSRGRTGCLNCRRRRKKCDEEKPSCSKCLFRAEVCEWDTGLTFRSLSLDPSHPSMLQARGPKLHGSKARLKIVDVKFDKRSSPSLQREEPFLAQVAGSSSTQGRQADVIPSIAANGGREPSSSVEKAQDLQGEPELSSLPEQTCLPITPEAHISAGNITAASCSSPQRPQCQRFPYEEANPADCIADPAIEILDDAFVDTDNQTPDHARSNSDTCSVGVPSGPWSGACSGSSATSVSSQSAKLDSSQTSPPEGDRRDGLTYVECLDQLMVNTSPSANNRTPSPFRLPAGALRLQLSQKIQDLTASTPTEHAAATSYSSGIGGSANALLGLKLTDGYRSKGIRLVDRPLLARPLGCTKLVKRRQLELWRNYSQTIAPWLDVCGSRTHFQHALPLMAKSADYLHYAVLAVSARHMELGANISPGCESMELYDDAVHMLIPELHTLETPMIAAYILLCVNDLMTYPVAECRTTLETCAQLLDLANVNARCNGFQQSLFWTFANLSTWSSCGQLQSPPLSVRQYYPSDSIATATSYIRSQTWGEGYSKYALYLTSTVISIISNGYFEPNREQSVHELNQWMVLHDLLEDWHNCRPEGMQALMSYPSILDDERNRFPMVLYSSAAAVVGNLLYHTASILLLRCRPPLIVLPKNHKSLIWHARQVCGIVSENHENGVWPHATQSLLVAGEVIANDAERSQMLEMLQHIQSQCGWRTKWYADELRKRWWPI